MKLTKVFVGYYILSILTGLYSTLSINLSLLQKRWVEIEKDVVFSQFYYWIQKKNEKEKKRRQRRFWSMPGRTSSWWQSFRNNLVVEEQWRENFRQFNDSNPTLIRFRVNATPKRDITLPVLCEQLKT